MHRNLYRNRGDYRTTAMPVYIYGLNCGGVGVREGEGIMIPPNLPTVADLKAELDQLAEQGGAVIIGITTIPSRLNYAEVSWQHFNLEEVKALRRAVANVRRKRASTKPLSPSCYPSAPRTIAGERKRDSGQRRAKKGATVRTDNPAPTPSELISYQSFSVSGSVRSHLQSRAQTKKPIS